MEKRSLEVPNRYREKNFAGFSMGMEAIPTKIFQSKKCDWTPYVRGHVRNRIIKNLNRLDGSIDSLVKVMKKLQSLKPLPADGMGTRVYEENGVEKTQEFPHNGNETVNRLVQAQIQQLESLIKVRLGRKKEGRIDV